MSDCIFCKIAKGEIPSAKIWEDEKHIAFLDVRPNCLGHTLIIPKKHSRWLWDMADKDYIEFMLKTKIIVEKLRKYFNTDWVEEGLAGMEVEHTHIHLFPRRIDDNLGTMPIKPMQPKPSTDELNKLANEIRK